MVDGRKISRRPNPKRKPRAVGRHRKPNYKTGRRHWSQTRRPAKRKSRVR